MLSFSQFLLSEEMKYLYGINHTDRDAPREIHTLATTLGYTTVQRGGHIQVHFGDEYITAISTGKGGLKRHRDTLMAIHNHQKEIGGFDGIEHQSIKDVKKARRDREVRVDDANQLRRSSNLR